MAPNQWTPLQQHPTTGEPYIRLPAPHENIIITPFRKTDGDSLVEILNDPKVYQTLAGPPYPYLPEHADEWIAGCIAETEGLLRQLAEAESSGFPELRVVGGCPVGVIREQGENGSEMFLGNCSLARSDFYEILGKEQKMALLQENNAKTIGDRSIIWQFGDYLRASHHGRGIMSMVVKVLLEKWAIPRMAVEKIDVSAYFGNIGSLRVFQKNGFVLKGVVKDMHAIAESKGGGSIDAYVLEWRKPTV